MEIRTAEEAAEEYKTYDDWQYADREAAWKWMFERGVEAGNAHIYEAEAEQITRPLRELLKRTLPMLSGAGCGTLAAEICTAIGVPNAALTGGEAVPVESTVMQED